jgi:hypothetical protein
VLDVGQTIAPLKALSARRRFGKKHIAKGVLAAGLKADSTLKNWERQN